MPLIPGARLGPYEIAALIGEGGMGQVYRATDTNLGRQVAVKVLPDAFAQDAERLARFDREAKTLASLNHPNIAAIYGLERGEGTTGLVMELVQGPTLADRLAQGPIPIDEALPIAKQIAKALEAAHEQGIIHRELKPANIKVRDDGTVKVLDFGLAKAMEPIGSIRPSVSQSPTLTTPAMTHAGVILGTAAYMSPEQAKGRTLDERSDVWAFGAVFYEMLTGQRAFAGDDVTDTLASVLKSQPDWSVLTPDVPTGIRAVLRRCLEKDRSQRVAHAGTVSLVLEEASSLAPTASLAGLGHAVTGRRNGVRRLVLPAFAALVGIATGGIAVRSLAPSSALRQVARLTVTVPDDEIIRIPTGQHAIGISPDGTRLAYVAGGQLFVRELSGFAPRPVTVPNATVVSSPAFSPDGESIAFHAADGTIKRVDVDGGAAVTICQVDAVFGMSWYGSGIIFGRGSQGIARCPVAGGAPEQLAVVAEGYQAHGPQLLPDSEHLLFTIARVGQGRRRWDRSRWDDASIVVEALASGERKTVLEGGSDARYLSTGHVLYALGGIVLAVPFDIARQEWSARRFP